MAYLTFDDGPDPVGTPLLLRTLERHGARATFFLEGARAMRERALVRDLAAAGHGVGSHGWMHLDAWRHPRGAVADLARGEAALEDLLGQPVRDVRPPYGRVTPAILRWLWGGGRRLVLWGLMPGDFLASRPPDRLARMLRRGVGPGRVVVLHDGPPARRAAAALDGALPTLCAGGLRFVPLPPPPDDRPRQGANRRGAVRDHLGTR